jgi:hypothetical protein
MLHSFKNAAAAGRASFLAVSFLLAQPGDQGPGDQGQGDKGDAT